jgi:nicotinate-nucleotide pyrophosphorylase (carboxylating)
MPEYFFPAADAERAIAQALAEDVGAGDITSLATVPEGVQGRAVFQAKDTGVLCGLPVLRRVYAQIDPRVELEVLVEEGSPVTPGTRVAIVRGPARSLLTGERVALNFLQHLSAIATRTAGFVKLLEGTSTRIIDTRKTVPGLRALAKYAVRVGGGHNHRFGLYDGVLIKDNHIQAAGGIRPAVARAREIAPHMLRVEVETENLEQVQEALDAGADVILLDNMDPETRRQAVTLCRGRALTEASGGINEQTIRAIAETGVDLISVGALTHSVTALDISLDWE